jgi:hypothetical protein
MSYPSTSTYALANEISVMGIGSLRACLGSATGGRGDGPELIVFSTQVCYVYMGLRPEDLN